MVFDFGSKISEKLEYLGGTARVVAKKIDQMVAATRRKPADQALAKNKAAGKAGKGAGKKSITAAIDDAEAPESEGPVEQAEAAERALDSLLATPTLLLAPSAKEREAVLQASSLLFLLAKGFRGEAISKRGSVGLTRLHTVGCDAEQVWGQLEVGGLMDQQGLKRDIKMLLKSQDRVDLVPKEEEEEDEEDDEESGSDDEMAREAAKMRRLARGEAVSDDEDDEEDDANENIGAKKGKPKAEKGGKKPGSDAFWDDMEKFVQQGEDEEAEEEEEMMGNKKQKGKRPVDMSEANAKAIEFVVTGCGTEDVQGVYRRNDKICKFGVAYSNGRCQLNCFMHPTKDTPRPMLEFNRC